MKYPIVSALIIATLSIEAFGVSERSAYNDVDCQSNQHRVEVSFSKGSTLYCKSGYFVRSSEDTLGTCLSLDSAKRIKNLNFKQKYLACATTVVELGPILKID